jgi:DNA polymerase-4
MNAFFASVEQAHRSYLKGKPVLISADPYGTPKGARSVAATASYEARAYGVKTGMPLYQAKELCPQAIIVEGDARKYTGITLKFLEILRNFTDLVEPYSIDEAFIDITQTAHLFGGKVQVAREIKRMVRENFGLTCSIGIAPNKLVAKIASDLEKPDGLVVFEKKDLPEALWHLPVDAIPGIGKKRLLKLNLMGIYTLKDLALYPQENLRRAFGIIGVYLQNAAYGLDDSPVVPEEKMPAPKSISASSTFGKNTADREKIESALFYLTEKAVLRLKKHRLKAGIVGIWLRYEDFSTTGQSTRLKMGLSSFEDIRRETFRILEHLLPVPKPVRLVGVYLAGLSRQEFEKVPLFEISNKKHLIDEVILTTREKCGADAIARARSLLGKRILLT